MADKYVKASGSNTAPYESWAAAATTFKAAIEACAAGETVWVDSAFVDTYSADTTITFPASGIRVVSTSDTTNQPPLTYAAGAKFSTTTTGADLTLTGAVAWAVHGIAFDIGGSTNNCFVSAVGTPAVFDGCDLNIGGTNAASAIYTSGNHAQYAVNFQNCTFSWASTGHGFSIGCPTTFVDCDMSDGSTHPSVLVEVLVQGGAAEFIGCDLSDIDTVLETTPLGYPVILRQCSLKSGYTLVAPAGLYGEVIAYDCAVAADDRHIMLHHVEAGGSTIVDTAIYATDNIADANLSWKVSGNSSTSKARPYRSPWLSVYHSGTSAITPYLECVRSGSATAYNEDEVWVEMTAKTAGSGSTRADLFSNRSDPMTTGVANENSSKTASDWTGENATSWFGKLQLNAAITPAEPGHISARICVSGNHTVYVDPQIRGRT